MPPKQRTLMMMTTDIVHDEYKQINRIIEIIEVDRAVPKVHYLERSSQAL